MNQYLRDGRSPIPKSENTSKVMRANKGKNTKPELILRKTLWHAGYKGYRLHPKKVTGKPDIVFSKKKIAIFVNGCFWHRCSKCNPNFPKSNQRFWKEKFTKNKERDIRKIKKLQKEGWKPIVVWECEINNELENCIKLITEELNISSIENN